MQQLAWLLVAALLGGFSLPGCLDEAEAPSQADAQLTADRRVTTDLGLLSDAEFFARLQYAAVEVGSTPDVTWAQSSYLATLDMIDSVRLASDHRAELQLFLLDDERYLAEYRETKWSATTPGWRVTVRRFIDGAYALAAAGQLRLDGLGTAKRTMVQGRAALVVRIDHDIVSAGIRDAAFVTQQALSSAEYQPR